MAQRRFGPTLGPGVAVIEKEGGKQIQASPLGVTGYIGVLEKGIPGDLLSCFSKNDFTTKCGGRIDGSLLPDACQDFWDHSGGAGELHLVRVTDGLEEKSQVTLWNRENPKQKALNIVAKSGGRWAGREQVVAAEAFTSIANEVTLTTTLDVEVNEFAGGILKLDAVPSKSYRVVSNTAGPNSVFTLEDGSTAGTDHNGDPDEGFSIELERDKAAEVMVEVVDGEIDAATLFGIKVYEDGGFVKYYPNLSMDPASAYYVENIINDDTGNEWITVTDVNTGGYGADKRPATFWGDIFATGVTATTLKAVIAHAVVVSAGTPTFTLGTVTSAMKYRLTIICTYTALDVFDITVQHENGEVLAMKTGQAAGSEYSDNPLIPPFTIGTDAATLAADTVTIYYLPFQPDELVNGRLIPDDAVTPRVSVRIDSNTVDTVTVSGVDLTALTDDAKFFKIEAPLHLTNGYDGDTPAATDFTDQLNNPNTTPFHKLVGGNKGLVKLAAPGITQLLSSSDATIVEKAGVALAEAKNWQWRYEIPNGTVTEDTMIDHINTTLGRNDFAKVAAPSYAKYIDPDKDGILKTVPLTGAIHGREAAVARNYDGYHKAGAGVGVTLFKVVELPATELNEEVLNPQGLNVIKLYKGNVIIWGDRMVALDPSWKFAHHREAMSHYENTLRESFDFAIFEINDQVMWSILHSSLTDYFLREFRKRALRGDTFGDAAKIKVDAETNTASSMAAGELNAEVTLQLADTIERFIITMSKDGVFEAVS